MKWHTILLVAWCLASTSALAQRLTVECPAQARVFDLCEMRISLPPEMAVYAGLPDTQVHDAYDADRDGMFVRLSAEFRQADAGAMTVSGFAMREKPDAPWQWRVRWSPKRVGAWQARITFEGRAAAQGPTTRIEQTIATPIIATADARIAGPLIAPSGNENPRYLRRQMADGASTATWLFGACRAWVVQSNAESVEWAPHEGIDRETELFVPMRESGYNLLNQWMAPWEFLLVHCDRAEFWREADGAWKRTPRRDGVAWTSYQCYDQGRAAAFDRLVAQCEGDARKPTIYMLLSPLPHQCFQAREHPWGDQESGWSPENDGGKRTLDQLNGFSIYRPHMAVWDFFKADPRKPADDWRSQLFDHQANYYRYLFARWGYSRAVGVWVLMDEVDAIGDEVSLYSKKTGWWGHAECERWLADIVRLFRGQLKRADGMAYDGDPFRHPLHAAATSFGGGAERGANLDWDGGLAVARPDIMGWHWYPRLRTFAGWPDFWVNDIDGIASYARAPLGARPRLISEFGAPDRYHPTELPTALYPTLYHHAIWSAIFSGQAGTPMDWDDGKEYGELRWRERKGAFDREHYPVDNTAEMKALRRFLGDLTPEDLAPCSGDDARVRIAPRGDARAFALHTRKTRSAVYGWIFCAGDEARFALAGLAPGEYAITWYDPWTGDPVPVMPETPLTIGAGAAANLDASPALARLRGAAGAFPAETRLAKGQDVAFKMAVRK